MNGAGKRLQLGLDNHKIKNFVEMFILWSQRDTQCDLSIPTAKIMTEE